MLGSQRDFMKQIYLKYHTWLNITVFIVAAFAVFSNNYKHDYPLDCRHLLLENPSVRSLKFIPPLDPQVCFIRSVSSIISICSRNSLRKHL